MPVSFLRSWIYGSSITTDTSAENSGVINPTSSTTPAGPVTLSVTDTSKDDQHDNDDDENDDIPPAFPSLNSIQRSGPSISVSVSARSTNGISSSRRAKRDTELMPPPSILPSPPLNPDTQFQPTNSSSSISNKSSLLSPPSLNGSGIPSSSFNSLQLPPSTIKVPTLTPKQRKKVVLAPGHSTLDWAALKSSGKDLRGVPTLLRVTPSMLKLHKQPNDAWTAINGKVYNITPYLDYHPGGVKELMRVAGRDGTKLFALTHAWVNVGMMLDECMVGFLVPEPLNA